MARESPAYHDGFTSDSSGLPKFQGMKPTKRILYGIVGVGMGHATRSRVILDHLLAQGHEILVTASGTAPAFIRDVYINEPRLQVEEVAGYGMRFRDQRVDVGGTFLDLIDGGPGRLLTNLGAFSRISRRFHPDVVISDFEGFAHWYGRFFDVPVISLDNIQVLNRCTLDPEVVDTDAVAFQLAKTTVKAKMPGADHYLVSSFFDPKARKKNTTVVGPVLRAEILDAKRECGEHVLVYQSIWSEALLTSLRNLSVPIVAYGSGREGTEGNITFRPFSQQGFIDDLRTARAVVAGGGYSLMCEALQIGIPMLAIPLDGHVEQQLNAAYLAACGYGAMHHELTAEILADFLDDLDSYEFALQWYDRRGNGPIFAAIDELLAA